MKKAILLISAGILLSYAVQAQVHLFLEEKQIHLEDGQASAWVFPVSGTVEQTLDDFKDYLKNRSDIKLKKEGSNALMGEKVTLPAISTLRGDLIGMCVISEPHYSMSIVFKLGYDISLNSKDWPNEMESLRHYSKAFMAFHYEQTYARRIEDLEDVLKDVQKDKSQNENKMGSITKKINNLSKKIAKETDSAKIQEYENEINTLEGDLKLLVDATPGFDEKIGELTKEIEQNKKESNTYLSTIGGF